MENLISSIRSKIETGIPDVKKLIVKEEGDVCSGSYVVVVVSPHFENMGLLERQRKVK